MFIVAWNYFCFTVASYSLHIPSFKSEFLFAVDVLAAGFLLSRRMDRDSVHTKLVTAVLNFTTIEPTDHHLSCILMSLTCILLPYFMF